MDNLQKSGERLSDPKSDIHVLDEWYDEPELSRKIELEKGKK